MRHNLACKSTHFRCFRFGFRLDFFDSFLKLNPHRDTSNQDFWNIFELVKVHFTAQEKNFDLWFASKMREQSGGKNYIDLANFLVKTFLERKIIAVRENFFIFWEVENQKSESLQGVECVTNKSVS